TTPGPSSSAACWRSAETSRRSHQEPPSAPPPASSRPRCRSGAERSALRFYNAGARPGGSWPCSKTSPQEGRRPSADPRVALIWDQYLPERGAPLGHAVQYRADGERIWPQRRIIELGPVDRGGHGSSGSGAGTVGRDERLVDHVLRVIEPRAAPARIDVPFPADQVRHPRADGPGQLLHPRAGLVEAGPGCDGHPDLDASLAGDFGTGPHSQVL